MKKSLFLLTTAAVVLASCNNDVKVNENTALVGSNVQKEIAFSAYSHTPKRSIKRAPIQGAEFPDQSMEVSAYLAGSANYFSKTTFAQDGSTGIWKATPAKYWPLSAATLNFFAVTGEAAANITIQDDLSAASVTYSSDTQSDIMYAFNRGAVEQAGSTLTFPDNVPMQFKHAFALINFQVKGSTAIKVKNIKLNGARYTGTLALANTGATAATGDVTTTVTWTPADAVNAVAVPNITNQILSASYFPTNASAATATDWASLMIIPTQQAGSSTSYGFTTFTITYCIMNGENEGPELTYTYAPTGTPASPSLTAVQAGFKYTYRINMTLHEILIAPEVVAWEDGGSEYIEVPETTIEYNESTPGAFTATAAGTYTFIIADVPANGGSTYTVEKEDGAVITSVAKGEDTTPASGEEKGNIVVKVKLSGTAGTQNVVLKLGDDTKMTIAVTMS